MAQCPFLAGKMQVPMTNKDWWPQQLNLSILAPNQHAPAQDGPSYKQLFSQLDLPAVKADIVAVLKDSKPWWPADWGHYGPFMVRLAWHAAGTYRAFDGRGGANSGNSRLAPLNSWPDNQNLDKAKRLLWPIKQKYGKKLSWADLYILVGNVAMEDMGLKMFGFAGGREDIYQAEEDVDWGYESEWLNDGQRYMNKEQFGAGRELHAPYGAVQMGLIYVNPQGPGGNCDPLAAAHDIRETFGKMAVDDEYTVALIAGGHTFGKGHGAVAGSNIGPEPEGAPLELQGLGWKNSAGKGHSEDTMTSGFEGAWTANPTKWDNGYFTNLFKFEWEKMQTPAGNTVWRPTDREADKLIPDAHVPGKTTHPVMYTTDLALKMDPKYKEISQRFHDDPAYFADIYAKAWYKLTHRDMGPLQRCVGSEVAPGQLWQDLIPEPTSVPSESDCEAMKAKILGSALSVRQLVTTAWASASTWRHTDFRGGANGARVALEPQKSWEVNEPAELAKVLSALDGLRGSISLADMVVLAGCAGVEEAAKQAGVPVKVPFTAGRADCTQDMTDVDSFKWLEPKSDGFRNFHKVSNKTPEELLVDRAHLLKLSAPEMTVLVGGLRVLGANHGGSTIGQFTQNVGVLSNDYFVNLLSMENEWVKTSEENVYEGKNRDSGAVVWKGSRVDLAFGSNSTLRAIAEYYGCGDSKEVFVKDFVKAWVKVMNSDRYDLQK